MHDDQTSRFRWVNPHAENLVVFTRRSPEYQMVARYLIFAPIVARIDESDVMSDGEWFWDSNYLDNNVIGSKSFELDLCLKIFEVGSNPRYLSLAERRECYEFVMRSFTVDQALEFWLTGDVEPDDTVSDHDVDT